MDNRHQMFDLNFDHHFQSLHCVEILLFTYYSNPQNTADRKYKVSAAIEVWQCFLKEKKGYEFSTMEVKY